MFVSTLRHFWATRGKLGTRAEKLLTLRGGHLIEIDGADKFFVQLQEMVEGLKESKAAHPLSVNAQVSAVKKFVASPQYRVRFHDLLVDEANRVRAVLDFAFTVEAGPVDTPTIKARFEAYDTSTAGLQHMLFAQLAGLKPIILNLSDNLFSSWFRPIYAAVWLCG
ncbi:hypothetical protein HFO58_10600 [Rhizobium leguminosarum]|nr:hypothetical protein [Rhizobium leguminosarum]